MILSSEYKSISNYAGIYYDTCILSINEISNLFNILSHSEWSDGDPNKIFLKNSLNELKSNISNKYIDNNYPLNIFVTSLQNHVIQNYGNINDFLADNEILVSRSFSILSNMSGFLINESNIE